MFRKLGDLEGGVGSITFLADEEPGIFHLRKVTVDFLDRMDCLLLVS